MISRRELQVGMIAGLLISLVNIGLAQEETASEKPQRQIYLLIGQSNMADRAPIGEEESGPIDRCWLLNNSDQWEPAQVPLNRYSTIRKGLGMQKLNPGYSFALTMLQQDKSLHLGLVVNAKGGSSIKLWAKGTKFYEEAVRRTKLAQQSGQLAGVLWHQGESDKDDSEYLAKLKALVENLRADLNQPDLPFVAGQVHEVPLVNRQIAALGESVKATSYVSSQGLTTFDRWHFDAKSQKLLGERYADEMQKLQSDTQSEQ